MYMYMYMYVHVYSYRLHIGVVMHRLDRQRDRQTCGSTVLSMAADRMYVCIYNAISGRVITCDSK